MSPGRIFQDGEFVLAWVGVRGKVIRRVLARGRQESPCQSGCMTEAESEREEDTGRCLIAGFEEGGRGRVPRNTGSPEKGRKAEKQSPPEPPEGTQSCQHVHVRASDFQNWKITNLGGGKPQYLWQFVMAAASTPMSSRSPQGDL